MRCLLVVESGSISGFPGRGGLPGRPRSCKIPRMVSTLLAGTGAGVDQIVALLWPKARRSTPGRESGGLGDDTDPVARLLIDLS